MKIPIFEYPNGHEIWANTNLANISALIRNKCSSSGKEPSSCK